MNTLHKTFYADFKKISVADDESLEVWGIASTQSVDADGEIILPAAMAAARDDYMKWGAVREMHVGKAAGTAIDLVIQEDGTSLFGATVVDTDAIKKIRKNVYKGFSVGGKVLARDKDNPKIITKIRLDEISLVDRPCNPEAVFTMYKALDSGKDIEQASSDGTTEAEAGHLSKALYTLGEMASALASVRNAIYDRSWMSTDSESVDKLKAIAKDMVEVLHTIIDEEATAMNEEQKAIDKSQETGDLEKTVEAEGLEKSDNNESEQNQNDDSGDEMAKAIGNLTKVVESLSKIESTMNSLVDRVTKLEATPQPPKGALLAVGKGDDLGKSAPDDNLTKVESMPDSKDPVQVATWYLRQIHANPQ